MHAEAGEIFVHPQGNDAASGSSEHPLRSVAAAVARFGGAGGTVTLREGVYFGEVEIADVHASADVPLVMRAAFGERAVLEATLPQFRGPIPNHAWRPDPNPTHNGEYISVKPIAEPDPVGNRVRGVFMDRLPYTRLVSYSRLEDLRAPGEIFPKVMPNDPAFNTFDGNKTTKGFKRPWVYLGPGVFLDDQAYVHVRLSHTNNNVPLWPDYEEQTDPRRLRIGISTRSSTVLTLRRCEHVVLRDLSLHYGGEQTVSVRACSDIVFDHVRIRAGSRALRLDRDGDSLQGCTRITLQDCRINGGIPTWHFRSDRKDGYGFKVGNQVVENDLGAATSGVCFSGNDVVPHSQITVEHSEIVNAHDISVFGDSPHYHHNWLDNINDDALVFIGGITNARVHHNVITRSLTALSFADSGLTGQVSVYRNLIDLRTPTLGVRPEVAESSAGCLRQGQFYKGETVEGPFDLFQNTCLTLDAGTRDEEVPDGNAASFTHFRKAARTSNSGRRRAFNNIFLAMHRSDETVVPIAFLPDQDFEGPTDGNLYHRVAPATADGRVRLQTVGPPESYLTVDIYRESQHHIDSRALYPPGFEKRGIGKDPKFRSIEPDGLARPADDLRLRIKSPARRAGVFLQGSLRLLDNIPINAVDTAFSRPDIGCYPKNDEPLAVGVDGRRHFPDDQA